MSVLEVTTRIGCGVACAYCPQEALVGVYPGAADQRVMSPTTFRACIDRVPASVDVHFTGYSEPWLNPSCTEMVLYAHNGGHRLQVSTTLVGMCVADVDRIAAIPFKKLQIHLPSAQVYEYIPVTPGYLATLGRILELGIASGLHYHGQTIHPMLEHLRARATLRPIHDRAGNLLTSKGGIPNRRRLSARRRGILACERVRQNVLLPNGQVTLCCMDYGMRHVLGSLLAGDYEGLFRGPEHRRVMQGLGDEKADTLCRQCTEALDVDLRARLMNRAMPRAKRGLALLFRDPSGLVRRLGRRVRPG